VRVLLDKVRGTRAAKLVLVFLFQRM
jgi:hypothetical protein